MAVNVENSKKDILNIYKNDSGEWRWRRVAKTIGTQTEIVGASTQGYSNKSDCIDNAKRQFIECDITED